MNGQVSCEGPLGKTSLFDMEALTAVKPETMFRKDIDLSKAQVSGGGGVGVGVWVLLLLLLCVCFVCVVDNCVCVLENSCFPTSGSPPFLVDLFLLAYFPHSRLQINPADVKKQMNY